MFPLPMVSVPLPYVADRLNAAESDRTAHGGNTACNHVVVVRRMRSCKMQTTY